MRTIEVKILTFNELSEQAKENAFENWRNEERDFFWMEENLESLKQGLLHFGFELKDWSIDYYNAKNAYLRIEYQNSNGYDEENALQGVRLWKFINNNMLDYWCKYKKKYEYGKLLDGNCPFTGYCVDEDFLEPVRQFMKKPIGITFQELMEDCAHNVMKCIELDYEYQTSKDYFIEMCIENIYEFYEDGSIV